MGTEKKPLVKVDIGSPVSFKAEIKTEIPGESSGRLLDALTDIFRPFSESRGLKADQIRLQREEVLIEIARRARERLNIEGLQPKQVSTKFLIPFMEKASIEENDSELIDTWAKLLTTASQDYESSLVRYVSVLAELSSREVKFLHRIINGSRAEQDLSFLADAPLGFAEWYISRFLARLLNNSLSKSKKVTGKRFQSALQRFISEVEVPGGLAMHVVVDDYYLQHSDFKIHDPNDKAAMAVLESLGLLRNNTITFDQDGKFCFVECVHLTEFGLGFCLACDPDLKKLLSE